jgi:acyl-CoA thioester hydrolase
MNRIEEEILKAEDKLEIKIPFHDTDAAGWVYHSNYLKYADEGFIAFFERNLCISPLEEIMNSGNIFPIRSLTINYEAPAKFGEIIIIKTRITSIVNKSFKLEQEIYNRENNTLLAIIKSVRVIFNLRTQQTLNVLEYFKACMLT